MPESRLKSCHACKKSFHLIPKGKKPEEMVSLGVHEQKGNKLFCWPCWFEKQMLVKKP